MASITGHFSEEEKEKIKEEYVENGPFESYSDFIHFCVGYTVYNKYGEEL